MSVAEWMTTDPITIGPDASVREARLRMREEGIRHLPVVSEGRLIGIVSDRDVRIDDRSLRRLETLERLGDVTGEGKPVEAVMSESVHTVTPVASMGDAARLMLSRRVSALPVVDENFVPIGIVTTTDCLLVSLTHDKDLESRHD